MAALPQLPGNVVLLGQVFVEIPLHPELCRAEFALVRLLLVSGRVLLLPMPPRVGQHRERLLASETPDAAVVGSAEVRPKLI